MTTTGKQEPRRLAVVDAAAENQEQSSHGGSRTRHAVDAGIHFVAGFAGGVAEVYVGQPLDTVKVKMQTFGSEYRNAFDCLVKTYRQDGIARGLYAGTVPALTANISEKAVMFMAYGICQKWLANIKGKQHVNDLTVLDNAVAGSASAFFSSIALCPAMHVKCKLQTMREMRNSGKMTAEQLVATKNIGPVRLTGQILRLEGVRGLFTGLVPTFAREMPGHFFFFGGYELSRYFLTPSGKTKDEIGAVRTIICGGFGGVALWVAVFPADVISSRVQVGSATTVVGGRRLGFLPMLLHIVRTEGLRALYNGLGPTVVRTFPATGALFLAVESTKKAGASLYSGIE